MNNISNTAAASGVKTAPASRIVEALIVYLPARHTQCEEPVRGLFHQAGRTANQGADILWR